jgi:hypothetical protein
MSNANEIRKSLEVIAEATAVVAKGATKGAPGQVQNVKVNLETLARQSQAKAKYDFNKSFLTFRDIMDDPRVFVEKYRKETQKDTSRLVDLINGMKEDPKYTDKEKYLRIGYESKGFSNGRLVLVWWKEKAENLFIFTHSKNDLMDVRDFLKFFSVIR